MTFGGVFSVLPTPFGPTGDFDPDSLKRVIDLFINDGVHGFTALGVTSEVARLTDAERDTVLHTTLAHVSGRVPVVVGATADGLRTCIEYTRRAKAAGAAAVMISPPRMLKINSDGAARHFVEVAAAVDVPIIVQDYPPISGYTMEPSLLARIARDVPAAHHQARGSADSGEDIAHPRADAGADRLNLRRPGWRLSVGGADGRRCRGDDRLCVSRDPRQIVRLFREERIDEAADVFYRKVPLMRFEFQDGIGMAIRKEVLRRRGAIASAAIRPPGGVLDQPTREALDRVLAWTMGSEGEH